ncbi:MAG: FimV family protein [Rhodospirillaceae bacterium]
MFQKNAGARDRAVIGRAATLSVIAAFIGIGFGGAHAASLGKLEITSGLGEPFRGRIEVVSATRHELDTLGARLGSEGTYRQAGVAYSSALQSLRFNLAKHSRGGHYISVTSSQPFNEPILDLVVELAWFGGANSYAYTALVDPAASAKSPTVAMPNVVAQASTTTETASTKPGKPKRAAGQQARTAPSKATAADRAIDEQIRQKEAQLATNNERLAAAQERIAELQRTVQEQQQLMKVAAEEAIANDMRKVEPAPAAAPAPSKAKPAPAPAQASTDLLSDPVVLGSCAAVLIGLFAVMRKRRRRVGGEYVGVEPALQPAA